MWTLRLVFEYLAFLLRSRTPSSVHSPYLYDLLPHAFDSAKGYYAFAEIERARHTLRQSEQVIAIPDPGAGSRKHYRRTVGDFVGAALSSPRQCEVLFRLAERHKPAVTIELGSAVGISTCYLARAAGQAKVYAFEANDLFLDIAENVMRQQQITNVTFVPGYFDDTLEPTLAKIGPVDLAFIDGNHKLEPSMAYFDLICAHASDRAIIVIDDIRWSADMMEAWTRISTDERTRVAIDAFSFGLIFLGDRFRDREQQAISPSLLSGGPILG